MKEETWKDDEKGKNGQRVEESDSDDQDDVWDAANEEEESKKKGEADGGKEVEKEVANVPEAIPGSQKDPRKVKGIFQLTQIFWNKLWQCSACSYLGRNKEAALIHLKNVHMYPKKLTCTVCYKSYETQEALDRHKRTVHPPEGKKPRKKRTVKPGGGRAGMEQLICTKCKETFKYQASLEEHYRQCIFEMDCSKCGKTFRRGASKLFKFKSNIQRHERQCGVVKRIKRECKFCGKKFSRPRNCKAHMEGCADNPDRVSGIEEDEEEESEEREWRPKKAGRPRKRRTSKVSTTSSDSNTE